MRGAGRHSNEGRWSPPHVRAGGLSKMVKASPVVVVGRRGCCMVTVVRLLLQGQGVNPAVWEIADDGEETAVAGEIAEGCGTHQEVKLPAVYIGGRLVGGLDRLMAVHISGDLIPILRGAGALWL